MAQQADAQGCDTSDMLAVHRAFRREIRLLPQMVRATPEHDVVRAGLVATHARKVLEALEHHHDGEDLLVWPRLHARAEVPQALVYLMETQHAALTELVTATRQLLDRWAGIAGRSERDQLGLVLDNLRLALTEHLDDEERSLLPIAARTLSEPEWEQVGARELDALPKPQLFAQLGALLEDASDSEQAEILKRVPLSARLIYFLVGSRRYQRDCAQLRRGVSAVPVHTSGPVAS